MRVVVAVIGFAVSGIAAFAGVVGYQMITRPRLVVPQPQIDTLSSGQRVAVGDYVQEQGFTIIVFLSTAMPSPRLIPDQLDRITKQDPTVRVRTIDIGSTDSDVARQYDITEVPTVWLYRDGALVARTAEHAWRFFQPTADQR